MKTSSGGRLVVVSNRLPFQLLKDGKKIKVKESDGGLVSALKSYFENKEAEITFDSTVWIGAADFDEKRWAEFNASNTSPSSYQVEPLFFEKKNYHKFYNGFCNSTLWPLFHYFPSFVEFENETFDAYESVNHAFAEKIIATLQPGDTLWIHDYQLMLVPGLVRSKNPNAKIGFFLHIPFPSFEVFRMLHRPWKEKIVNGLLGADIIGFHTHEYVQHFLKTVQMVSGFDHKFRTIFLQDRMVKAEMFPLGIDFEKFHGARNTEAVKKYESSIRNNFRDMRIIFSVDRLDYTKGITHRLSGFERFLELYPEWRGKVVFILVVVPSREIVSKYNERKMMIEEQIGRINGNYSTLEWQPVLYRYNHLSFPELTALYNVSDVGLITPLRDGMNLVAKEYIASKEDHGVLILSELAGAANELGEAMLVNPMDKVEVAESIAEALRMPDEVQKEKIAILQERLKQYTVMHWMKDFLHQLEETKGIQLSDQTRHLADGSLKLLRESYSKATKRLILLDYDGTLVPFNRNPADAIPGKDVLKILETLTDDERNDVTIISGRDGAFLDKWFGALPVNLVSEHGAAIRLRNEQWKNVIKVEQSWKEIFRPIFDVYCQRSPGSFVEEKKHTLVWHYRKVGGDLGFMRSRELLDNLYHMVRNSQLNIIDGKKVIEIRLSGIDKGTVAKQLLQDDDYDFVMAIGDDKTDEDMFTSLEGDAFTIKIGPGHTAAKYYLGSQQEATRFIGELSLLSGTDDAQEFVTALPEGSSYQSSD